MENLIFTAAGLSAVMLPLLASFILAKKSGKAVPALWGVLLFGAYGAAVFRLTGAGTVYDLCRYGLETDFTHINLIPFSQIKSRLDLQGCLLNIAMMIPLGAMLPLFWPKGAKFLSAAAIGGGFSLLIELSQLMNSRRTDIDDLICNTLGACLGFILCRIVFPKKRLPGRVSEANTRQAALYLLGMFAGRFLFYDGFGLAKLLYHF